MLRTLPISCAARALNFVKNKQEYVREAQSRGNHCTREQDTIFHIKRSKRIQLHRASNQKSLHQVADVVYYSIPYPHQNIYETHSSDNIRPQNNFFTSPFLLLRGLEGALPAQYLHHSIPDLCRQFRTNTNSASDENRTQYVTASRQQSQPLHHGEFQT